jgi:hypothetical protein
VIWVRTEKRKMMPLDYEPNPKGNIVLIDGLAHTLKKGEMDEGGFGCFNADLVRYMPHHATCAKVALFRKCDQKFEFLTNPVTRQEGIRCMTCGLVSWNPEDVAERYCGNCKVFHEEKS